MENIETFQNSGDGPTIIFIIFLMILSICISLEKIEN